MVKSGLKVSVIVVVTRHVGSSCGGHEIQEALDKQARTSIGRAFEPGVTLLDTVEVYGRELSESILGEVLGTRGGCGHVGRSGLELVEEVVKAAISKLAQHEIRRLDSASGRYRTAWELEHKVPKFFRLLPAFAQGTITTRRVEPFKPWYMLY
uniref:Aldo/keto reductase n=1 Tax=Fervidicoccus fontis TaxID=683846 RepID=A0A7J3ZJQ1_9CREN